MYILTLKIEIPQGNFGRRTSYMCHVAGMAFEPLHAVEEELGSSDSSVYEEFELNYKTNCARHTSRSIPSTWSTSEGGTPPQPAPIRRLYSPILPPVPASAWKLTSS